MSLTLEYVIVGLVVFATVVWAVRALLKTLRKTGGCSSCATSGDCPVARDPELISDLLEAGGRSGEGRSSS
jgi:hypothetical protein